MIWIHWISSRPGPLYMDHLFWPEWQANDIR